MCINEVHLKKAFVSQSVCKSFEVRSLSQSEDYCMTGLVQHEVWRGCADWLAVRLNLIEAVVAEVILF